jgi:RHS repeat-associated protein
VIDAHGIYSKHYYAGTQRIVSRIGEQDSRIFDLEVPCENCMKLQELQKTNLQQILAKGKLGQATFKPYQPFTYDEAQKALAEGDTVAKAPEQPPLYFYHPDHLGTSTFLTDYNGNAYQFFLNLPFGETMAEQLGSNYYNTPFKFNGKELDEETGLYYYGARYYDPRVSIWLSTDPLAEEFPDFGPYNYCENNPVNLTDPTGMSSENGDKSEGPPKWWTALKNWWSGDGSYKGSGWGHGARQDVAKKLGIDNKASNVAEVGALSQLQFAEVEIVGQARENMKNDQAMVSRENDLIELAKNDPRYGNKAYSFKTFEVVEFGGKRACGEMMEQLKDPFNPKYADTWKVAGNELTWLVRHAGVRSDVAVDKRGNITFNHTLTDTFDLRGGNGHTPAYNTVTNFLGPLYHDVVGGNDQLKIKAVWTTRR